MSKKFAFTLAEVLIALGIVGVVAAMTIPNFVRNYQEKVTVNKVMKTYAMLNEAFKFAINDHGSVNNWCNITSSSDYTVCAATMREILSEYLHVSKQCNYPMAHECIGGSRYDSAQGNKSTYATAIVYYKSIRLADGTGITFDARNWGNNGSLWCKIETNLQKQDQLNALSSNNCGIVQVDINGNNGPNRDGVDLFAFSIRRNGLVGFGQDGLHPNISFENNCLKSPPLDTDYGRGTCTEWVLQNKNLDYLHCPNKIGWNKARSCKE